MFSQMKNKFSKNIVIATMTFVGIILLVSTIINSSSNMSVNAQQQSPKTEAPEKGTAAGSRSATGHEYLVMGTGSGTGAASFDQALRHQRRRYLGRRYHSRPRGLRRPPTDRCPRHHRVLGYELSRQR